MKRNIIMSCGISGSGKSTLMEGLVDLDPELFEIAISSTTREPREGEIDGVHYYFLTEEEFLNRDMIESVQFNGCYYGVQASEFERISSEKHILLVVEPNGALQIAKYIQENELDIEPLLIHMSIPLSTIRENLEKVIIGSDISELKRLEAIKEDGVEDYSVIADEIASINEVIKSKKEMISNRLSRGTIEEDLKALLPEMKKANLKIDLSVKVLNGQTTESVYEWFTLYKKMYK